MDNILGYSAIEEHILVELSNLLWGHEVRNDVFLRWNQGFVFSEDEPTALLQYDGGPCAVIVPVQAFLLKNLLFVPTPNENWRQISRPEQDKWLCAALSDILLQLSPTTECITVVTHLAQNRVPDPTSSSTNCEKMAEKTNDEMPSCCNEQNTTLITNDVEHTTDATLEHATDVAIEHATDVALEHATDDISSSPKRQRLCDKQFHSELRYKICNGANDLNEELQRQLPALHGQHGVLLFLYSIILTKGLDDIKKEVADLDESLIDSVHGHGSQSLINLLVTGRAVSYVWDNDKDVSGLKLCGISSKSQIGFLTLLEHLRYCEVGWFLKNPRYPIWLLGSETHLSILFSQDKSLVGEETNESMARRMFNQFDLEGRGFISAESLGELMKLLDLFSVPDYVKIMAEKLDPEQLGVITLNSFMEEFYASEKSKTGAVQSFVVFHYNGLPRSCSNNKVVYSEASCTILDMPELQMISDFSPIKTCMMTKWPTIELNWKNNVMPSMN